MASSKRTNPSGAAARIAALFSLAAILAGCAHRGTVRIPRADATPPQAALDVVNGTNTWVLTSGQAPVSLHLTGEDSLVLIGLAEDRDGGVKEMALTGNAVAVCRADTGEIRRSDSFLRRSVTPEFPTGMRVQGVRSQRFILRVADFRRLCGKAEMKALSGAAGVRTVNFHGASAMSPTVQFTFAQPEAPSAPAAAGRVGRAPQRRHSHPSQALPKAQTAAAGRTPKI